MLHVINGPQNIVSWNVKKNKNMAKNFNKNTTVAKIFIPDYDNHKLMHIFFVLPYISQIGCCYLTLLYS